MASLLASLRASLSEDIEDTRSISDVIEFYEARGVSSVSVYSGLLSREKVQFFSDPDPGKLVIQSTLDSLKNTFVKCSLRDLIEVLNVNFMENYSSVSGGEFVVSIPIDIILRRDSCLFSEAVDRAFSAILYGLKDEELPYGFKLFETDFKRDLYEFCRIHLGPMMTKIFKGLSGKGIYRSLSQNYIKGSECLFNDNISSGVLFKTGDREVDIVFL